MGKGELYNIISSSGHSKGFLVTVLRFTEYKIINPQSTEIFDLNFQSLLAVARGSETQLEVTEKLFTSNNWLSGVL